MRVYSNYIFLPRIEKDSGKQKESANGASVIKIRDLLSFLKKTFPNLECDKEHSNTFSSTHRFNIERNNKTYEVIFVINSVTKQKYLTIEAQGPSRRIAIEVLASIQDQFLNSGVRKSWIDIVSYDGVSEYYGNKLYPSLNKLERCLRNLLLNVYTLNYGSDYTTHFDKEIINGAKSKIRPGKNTPMNKGDVRQAYAKKGKAINDIFNVQFFFESIDLGNLETLLFEEKVRPEDRETVNSFLNENENLSALDDGKLREMFSLLAPKSDWEIFFQAKIAETDVKNMLDKVREIRNIVAHCRVLTKSSYEESLRLCNQLISDIDKAIQETQENDFAEKNSYVLSKAIESLQESLDFFSKSIENLTNNASLSILNLANAASALGKTLDSQSYVSNLSKAFTSQFANTFNKAYLLNNRDDVL